MQKLDKILNCEDMCEMRRLVKEYYKTHLQGKYLSRKDIGLIKFTLKGIKETISHSNRKKLAFVPYIWHIVKSGKLGLQEEPKHTRKDGITHFIPITKTLQLFNTKTDIEILLAFDANGYFYYDLFTDNVRQKNRR
jgi:hypothetical protein